VLRGQRTAAQLVTML